VNWLLYQLGRIFIATVQALPLDWVARIGRGGGALAWYLDGRHRRVALSNLERVFGREKSEQERRDIARENFRRLGENYLCALKTAAMSAEALK
jgi:KDO2-lipid IV(A) lauroyltransferase